MNLRSRLDRGIEQLEIEVDQRARQRLLDFLALIGKWNQKIRLVGSAEGESAVTVLLVDSLAPLRLLSESATRLLDVGSGAGLPGIVLALARPDLQVVTIEPIRKKHAFQRSARRELEVENLTPLAERLEDHSRRDYDAAISRATFELSEWLERGRSLVRAGGQVIGMTNERPDLPGADVQPYPLDQRIRHLVVATP